MGRPKNRFPVSYAQQRLWLLDQLVPGSPYYNIPTMLSLRGRLRVPALVASLGEIVRRHEALRTTFEEEEGTVYQVIAPPAPFPLPLVDLSDLPGARRDAEQRRLGRREGERGFDLQRGPLVRAVLLKLADEHHAMVLNVHHIVSDGWSHRIFQRELVALYDACVSGLPSPLPPLPIQYVDFAAWQHEALRGESLEKKLEYWRRQLAGLPPLLPLPLDRPRPAMQGYRGKLRRFTVEEEVTARLRALSRAQGTTLFIPLVAAVATLLYRYTGQADVPIGIPMAGRDRVEVEDLIGFFIDTVVLRCDLSGNPTFAETVARLAEVALSAYSNAEVPFEMLVAELHPDRSLSYTPLFQVMLSLRDAAEEELRTEDLAFELSMIDLDVAKFDLNYDVVASGPILRVTQGYGSDLFDATTIQRMNAHTRRLLATLAAEPGTRIGDVALLTAGEHQQMLVDWNDSRLAFPQRTLHELFEEQAARTPEAIALVHPEGHLSYAGLDRRSNRLGHYLKELGVGPEVLVGLCADGSPTMMVGVLGILKAGGAYLPLDPTYPPARLAFMLEDAEAPVLLTSESLMGRLPEHDCRVVCLDHAGDGIGQRPAEPVESRTTPDGLAYVIFTSGSTGRPKGVLVPHRGVVNLAREFIRRLHLGPGSRVLQFASFGYDVSVGDFFETLLCGGKLILQPPERLLPGEGLARLMSEQGVTAVTLTPSALATFGDAELPALETIMVGGEACPTEVKKSWAPGRRFINAYGPTETTVCSTQAVCAADGSKPSIGRPMGNTEIYVLGGRLRPVAIGVAGELYVGGAGVTRGYLKRPGLTAERFPPDPFSGRPGARLYRTGDRVRFLRGGLVDFLGRVDHQVKVRGFRIELGEIEARLSSLPGVSEAAVNAEEVAEGDLRLVAYVQKQPGAEVESAELRQALLTEVPEFMVPSAFLFVGSMPLSASGKIDRKKLPEPEWGRARVSQRYVAPRTPEEERMAKLCAEMLKIERLGVEDDFFELGLHSLVAMQILSRIRQEFGVEIPLRHLFQAPTVAGVVRLAAELSQAEAETGAPLLRAISRDLDVADSVLVEFRASGSRPPLFCIHPADGEVHYFAELARLLGDEQPFYGLQAPDPLEFPERFHTLQEMVEVYTRAIRKVQPQGPYALAGWSLGAVVAFEMARQLHAAVGVSFLAVFDPTLPEDCEMLSEELRILRLFATEIGIQAGKPFEVPAEELEALDPRERYKYLLLKARIAGVLPAERGKREMERIYFAFRDNLRLLDNYPIEPPYPGPTTFILPAEGTPGRAEAWRPAFSGPFELHEVPGNHYTFLKPPHVEMLAEKLRADLEATFEKTGKLAASQ